MKRFGAIVLLLALVLLLVLGVSRTRYGVAVDRCLNLQARWGEQTAACAALAWPDDRSRERD
jgi:hypothetical protein